VELAWTADWLWGLPLIALTLLFHTTVVLGIWVLLARCRRSIMKRRLTERATVLLAVGTFGAIGLLLAILAGLEAAVWAMAYLLLGATDTLADAILYSVDSLTTRGASGLHLAPHWRLMGALEAANGVLLFGISTAFLAAILSEFWSWLRGVVQRPSRNVTTPSPGQE
jgi:hypothetical protein